jgi:hypothetical protein
MHNIQQREKKTTAESPGEPNCTIMEVKPCRSWDRGVPVSTFDSKTALLGLVGDKFQMQRVMFDRRAEANQLRQKK